MVPSTELIEYELLSCGCALIAASTGRWYIAVGSAQLNAVRMRPSLSVVMFDLTETDAGAATARATGRMSYDPPIHARQLRVSVGR